MESHSHPHSVDCIGQFCMKLARALSQYGTPTPRLESAIEEVATHFAVKCQILATPTGIQAAFGEGNEQRTYLERVQPGQIHLAKLSETAGVHDQVLLGRMGPGDATTELDRIEKSHAPWSSAITVLSFSMTSVAASVFLGGGVPELLAAGIVGLIIGLLAILLSGKGRVQGLFEFLAALSASISSILLAYLIPGLAPHIPTLAGLIVLIPGLTLTIAMSELSRQHLVSGTARLMGAAVLFLLIGMGVVVGGELRTIIDIHPRDDITPLPFWALWLALPLAATTFMVLFQARKRDWLPILIAGCLAIYGTRLGNEFLIPTTGIGLGVGLGALLVGLLGNLRYRVWGQPSEVTDLPGILLIVPGSLGFESLHHLLGQETVLGLDTAFDMTTTAVTLVIGLFLANLLLPPQRNLKA
jgi:uncharacterized membrane protein YjjP (DUF1212 family)